MSFYFKIKYHNPDFNPNVQFDYKAVTAKNFTEAAAVIEQYYGSELESFTVRAVDEPVIGITEVNFLTCYN